MGLDLIDLAELQFREAKHPSLYIESWSNSARTVEVRGFTKDSLISWDHTTNGDRSVATSTIRLDGMPVSLHAASSASPVRRGELYVRITLQLGGFDVGVISAGYLTDGQNHSWPPGIHESMESGKGLPRILQGTNPAAGAEITEAVPTNARWRVLGMRVSLVSDATSTNREVAFVMDDGDANNASPRIPPNAVQGASATQGYQWAGVGVYKTGTRDHLTPIDSGSVLSQASRIRTDTENLQAGDNFGGPILTVEEWIEE